MAEALGAWENRVQGQALAFREQVITKGAAWVPPASAFYPDDDIVLAYNALLCISGKGTPFLPSCINAQCAAPTAKASALSFVNAANSDFLAAWNMNQLLLQSAGWTYPTEATQPTPPVETPLPVSTDPSGYTPPPTYTSDTTDTQPPPVTSSPPTAMSTSTLVLAGAAAVALLLLARKG